MISIKYNLQPVTLLSSNTPDSKVHGANMGPIWGRQDPGGPHVGPMNFVIWDVKFRWYIKIYTFRITVSRLCAIFRQHASQLNGRRYCDQDKAVGRSHMNLAGHNITPCHICISIDSPWIPHYKWIIPDYDASELDIMFINMGRYETTSTWDVWYDLSYLSKSYWYVNYPSFTYVVVNHIHHINVQITVDPLE